MAWREPKGREAHAEYLDRLEKSYFKRLVPVLEGSQDIYENVGLAVVDPRLARGTRLLVSLGELEYDATVMRAAAEC